MRFIFPIILFFSLSCFANIVMTPPVRNIIWEGTTDPRVQVQVDPTINDIVVSLNKDKDLVPKSIGIVFYDIKGDSTILELKTIDPVPDPSSSMAHFSGTLSPAAQSFIGFEIHIPFETQTTVIHSSELKKLNVF